VFQLSLKKGLSVAEHLKLGEALRPLSSEGVLIIGSGQSTHNTGGPVAMPDWNERFRVWFHDVMTNVEYSPEDRKRKILAGKDEPSFESAHGRIEHYLPSIVSAAAGGYRAGTLEYEENVAGRFLMSYIRFNGVAK